MRRATAQAKAVRQQVPNADIHFAVAVMLGACIVALAGYNALLFWL